MEKNDKQTKLLAIMDDYHISAQERLATAEELSKSLSKHPFAPDGNAVCEIDLHCHSFHSDGYCSPTIKVFQAYRKRMRALAIADHDLLDGQSEALAAGEIFGIDVIPAIEFYTNRPGIEIIGHFPDHDAFRKLISSGVTEAVIEAIRNAKKSQLEEMIKRVPECFRKLGFDAVITNDDICRFVRNGISTKGDISVIMWQKYGAQLADADLAQDVKEFHGRYTTKDEMLNVTMEIELDLSPAAFIRRILEWGGLPGLSHPTELRKKEALNNAALVAEIEELALAGLQSIEVDGWRNSICPESGLHQTDLFERIRNEWNSQHPEQLPLLYTNGSDDHDQPGEGLELGCGKNRNLKPEFGKYSNITTLRQRQKTICQITNHI